MQDENVSRELRSLKIAVWVLAAVSAFNLAICLFSRLPQEVALPIPSSVRWQPSIESWEGLTIMQKIDRSSVVLVTRNVREGQREKAYVDEFLKRDPGVDVFYSVGDEIAHMSSDVKPDTRVGDGSIVLMEGSPASFRESYAIYDGRIPGLGDMPIAKVRNDIRISK